MWTGSIDFSFADLGDLNPLSYRWNIGLIYVGYRLALEIYQKLFALLVPIFNIDGSLLVDSRDS